jgi:Flp pilus assembly protein TadD
VFALVRCVKTQDRRWGLANIVLNILLMWTHLFAFLVLFTEGILLLALWWRQWRKILVWTLVHVVLLLPTAWWVSTIKPIPNLSSVKPTPGMLFIDIFMDDGLPLQWTLGYAASSPYRVVPYFDVNLEGTPRAIADLSLIMKDFEKQSLQILVPAGIILLALRLLVRYRRKLPWKTEGAVLLILSAIWLVPVLALFGLSHVWQPCLQERYTLYAPMAMGALLSLLIFFPKALLLQATISTADRPVILECRVNPVLPRTAIATIVVAIFGYNAILGVMLPSRIQYLAAAKVIAKEAGDNDRIVMNNALQERIFSYNTRWAPRTDKWPDISFPKNPQELLTLVDSLVDESSAVWVCYIQEALPDPFPRQLERFLDARGVSFTRQAWLGMQNTFLYRCSKTPKHLPLTEAAAVERFRALNRGPLSDTSFLEKWLADSLLLLAHPELTLAELRQACITAAPGDNGPRVKLAEALMANGNTEESLAEYRSVLADSPDDFEARLKYASLLLNIERKEEALAEFSKAHESAENTQTALEYGQTLLLLGRSSEAIPVLEKAIRSNPADAVLYPVLAMAQEAIGNSQEALKHYEKAVELRPANRAAHENLGHALLRLEQYDRAVTEFQTAVEIDPTITENRYWLCKALLKKGDHETAGRELRKAIEMNPRDVRVRIALIESLCEQGRKEEARTVLEAARQAGLRLPTPPPGCVE